MQYEQIFFSNIFKFKIMLIIMIMSVYLAVSVSLPLSMSMFMLHENGNGNGHEQGPLQSKKFFLFELFIFQVIKILSWIRVRKKVRIRITGPHSDTLQNTDPYLS
jgi:hypothetical protein